MKIDWNYIKGILEAFEESDQRVLSIYDLQKLGFDFEKDHDNFIFHMQLLCDEGLIDRESGHSEMGTKIFGITKGSTGYTAYPTPLRLTMSGHEFAANLRNKEIWPRLKNILADQGFSALVTLAKELSVGLAKKKVESILKDDA
jgi:hypothetical protein